MTKILVVDDTDDIRLALSVFLTEEGYVVLEASDGEEALKILRSHREPLIVLVDSMMPRLDGFGLLRVVVSDPSHLTRHRFILSTAQHNMSSSEMGSLIEQLQAPVVTKPFDLDQLLSVISHAQERIGA